MHQIGFSSPSLLSEARLERPSSALLHGAGSRVGVIGKIGLQRYSFRGSPLETFDFWLDHDDWVRFWPKSFRHLAINYDSEADDVRYFPSKKAQDSGEDVDFVGQEPVFEQLLGLVNDPSEEHSLIAEESQAVGVPAFRERSRQHSLAQVQARENSAGYPRPLLASGDPSPAWRAMWRPGWTRRPLTALAIPSTWP